MASFSVRIKNILKSYKKGFLMVLLLTLLSYISFNLWNYYIESELSTMDELIGEYSKMINEKDNYTTLELFENELITEKYIFSPFFFRKLLIDDITKLEKRNISDEKKIIYRFNFYKKFYVSNNTIKKDTISEKRLSEIINQVIKENPFKGLNESEIQRYYDDFFDKHIIKSDFDKIVVKINEKKFIDIIDDKKHSLKEPLTQMIYHFRDKKTKLHQQKFDILLAISIVFIALIIVQFFAFIILNWKKIRKALKKRKFEIVPFIVTIILIAIFVYLGFFLPDKRHSNKEIPYNYYELIRFGAMIGFAVLGYFAKKNNDILFMFIWFSSALLVNPFAKLALGKELWNIIDIIWIVLLVVSIPYNLYIRNKSL